ncbi:MAG: DUF3572 domain-containing protein [Bosea sp.]|jgi:hypothetical protein|nr:DUF3572 domain-containing protein [Bosea sp. (in: a-proteobacteria)]
MRGLVGSQQAEANAIRALGALASDAERLGRFLTATGLGPENLRVAAQDPGFLAGVLEHVMSDEALLIAIAAELGLKPEALAQARDVLAGPPAFD